MDTFPNSPQNLLKWYDKNRQYILEIGDINPVKNLNTVAVILNTNQLQLHWSWFTANLQKWSPVFSTTQWGIQWVRKYEKRGNMLCWGSFNQQVQNSNDIIHSVYSTITLLWPSSFWELSAFSPNFPDLILQRGKCGGRWRRKRMKGKAIKKRKCKGEKREGWALHLDLVGLDCN